jgi:hypothetical protein
VHHTRTFNQADFKITDDEMLKVMSNMIAKGLPKKKTEYLQLYMNLGKFSSEQTDT